MELIDDRKIGSQFAVLIANSDFSGLTDAECAYFDDWSSQFAKNDYPIVENDDLVWTKCDATGMYGDCVTVKIYRDQNQGG